MAHSPAIRRITINEVVKSFDVWRLLTGYDGPTVRRRLRAVVNQADRNRRPARTSSTWRLRGSGA